MIDEIDEIDVTDVLSPIDLPTLVLHRRGDRSIHVARAVEMADTIRDAELVVHDGDDHMPVIGDQDGWVDAIERFVTGRPTAPPLPTTPPGRTLLTFGLDVLCDGDAIPTSAWVRAEPARSASVSPRPMATPYRATSSPSCCGPTTTRNPPASPPDSRSRLSTVRRMLNGGVIADRDQVRLDLSEVTLDLAEFERAVGEGRPQDAAGLYRGEFLPESRTQRGRKGPESGPAAATSASCAARPTPQR